MPPLPVAVLLDAAIWGATPRFRGVTIRLWGVTIRFPPKVPAVGKIAWHLSRCLATIRA